MNYAKLAIGIAALMVLSIGAVAVSDADQADAAPGDWCSSIAYNSQTGFELDVTLADRTDVYVGLPGAVFDGVVSNGKVVCKDTNGLTDGLAAGTYTLNPFTLDDPEGFNTDITLVEVSFTSNATGTMDPVVLSVGYEYTLPEPEFTSSQAFTGWQIGGTTYAVGDVVTITENTRITAVYGGEAVVTGVEITKNPDKTEYEIGETFVVDGMEFTVSYSDGRIPEVVKAEDASGMIVATPSVLNEPGSIDVGITYDGHEAGTVTVTVNRAPEFKLDRIEVSGLKTEYFVGDDLDLSGMIVVAVYSDGSTEKPEELQTGYEVNPVNGTVLDGSIAEVIVNYQGKTASVAITVTPVVLDRIEITGPTKTDGYFVGDEVSVDGLVVTTVMNNGDRDTVAEYDWSPKTVAAEGNNTITVSYQGETATFEVTAEAVKLIGITAEYTQEKVYFPGDVFDKTGVTAIATYNNGSSKSLTADDLTVSGDLSDAGTAQLKVSYTENGVTVEGEITVTVTAVQLTGITAEYTQGEKVYFPGDNFVRDGLVVTAHYNDQRKDRVLGTEEYTISPETFVAAGDIEVEISYQGKTAGVTVKVTEIALDRIEAVLADSSMTYHVGDSLTKEDFEVTAVMNNGDRETVEDFDISPATLTSAGSAEITISYEGKEAVVSISVEAEFGGFTFRIDANTGGSVVGVPSYGTEGEIIYTVTVDPRFGYYLDSFDVIQGVDGTAMKVYKGEVNGSLVFEIRGINTDIVVDISFAPIITGDDDPVVTPPVIVEGGSSGDGDNSLVIVAIAAGAVVAVLAALILAKRD